MLSPRNKVLRAVLDTNIIISGLNFGGNPRRVLQMAEAGFFRMAVSDFVVDELARVLRRERFGWPEEEIWRALNQIERFLTQLIWQSKQLYDTKSASGRITEVCASDGSRTLKCPTPD